MTRAGSNATRAIRLGAKNLLRHKVRSVLTMMGIIFGVCSVIAMLAIGEGASQEAQAAIRGLGSTNIIVQSVKPPEDEQVSGQSRQGSQIEYGLTYTDAYRVAVTVPHVSRIMPIREIRDEALSGRRKEQVLVVGALPGYFEIRGRVLYRGRLLCAMDERTRANVCVVTENLARRLFACDDPLAGAVKIGSFYYRVVGIVASSLHRPDAKLDGAGGGRWDLEVYLPLATVRARFGETIVRFGAGSQSRETVQLHRLIVQCDDQEHVEAAALGIQRVMERFHEKRDYEQIVPLRQLREAEKTKRTFTIVLGCIAAISLLVGGIGIMNIMLATVMERTREIGVRRALGARRRDIVMQFLVETLVVSVGGGLIGVVVGWLIPLLVTWGWGIKTAITWWSLIAAFGTSVLVGVVFGIYPARQAANLDPIEALRHE